MDDNELQQRIGCQNTQQSVGFCALLSDSSVFLCSAACLRIPDMHFLWDVLRHHHVCVGRGSEPAALRILRQFVLLWLFPPLLTRLSLSLAVTSR